jgi:hypothetical protein
MEQSASAVIDAAVVHPGTDRSASRTSDRCAHPRVRRSSNGHCADRAAGYRSPPLTPRPCAGTRDNRQTQNQHQTDPDRYISCFRVHD